MPNLSPASMLAGIRQLGDLIRFRAPFPWRRVVSRLMPDVSPDECIAWVDKTGDAFKLLIRDGKDVYTLGGATSGHVIQEDGVPLTQRGALNFRNGLVASDSGVVTLIDVAYGGTTDLQTLGTASGGALNTVPRADHVHPKAFFTESNVAESISAPWTFSDLRVAAGANYFSVTGVGVLGNAFLYLDGSGGASNTVYLGNSSTSFSLQVVGTAQITGDLGGTGYAAFTNGPLSIGALDTTWTPATATNNFYAQQGKSYLRSVDNRCNSDSSEVSASSVRFNINTNPIAATGFAGSTYTVAQLNTSTATNVSLTGLVLQGTWVKNTITNGAGADLVFTHQGGTQSGSATQGILGAMIRSQVTFTAGTVANQYGARITADNSASSGATVTTLTGLAVAANANQADSPCPTVRGAQITLNVQDQGGAGTAMTLAYGLDVPDMELGNLSITTTRGVSIGSPKDSIGWLTAITTHSQLFIDDPLGDNSGTYPVFTNNYAIYVAAAGGRGNTGARAAGAGNVYMAGGNWNTGHLEFSGNGHIWRDATNNIIRMIGNAAPAATTSGIGFNQAITALGGGAAPAFGTIGGAGPAAAAQNSWLKVWIGANAYFIPLWA